MILHDTVVNKTERAEQTDGCSIRYLTWSDVFVEEDLTGLKMCLSMSSPSSFFMYSSSLSGLTALTTFTDRVSKFPEALDLDLAMPCGLCGALPAALFICFTATACLIFMWLFGMWSLLDSSSDGGEMSENTSLTHFDFCLCRLSSSAHRIKEAVVECCQEDTTSLVKWRVNNVKNTSLTFSSSMNIGVNSMD